MAYSAYCDTASATKWWFTGTGSIVDRLSEVMDDNPSGVEEADNPGNYQPWSNFMTEHVEDGIYQIHKNMEIGNGSTTTTIDSIRECVWFDDTVKCEVQGQATLNIGEIQDNWGINGSFWVISGPLNGQQNFCDGGTINIYAGMVLNNQVCRQYFNSGNTAILNSILFGIYDGSTSNNRERFEFRAGMTSTELRKVFFNNITQLVLYEELTALENVHVHYASQNYLIFADMTVEGGRLTGGQDDAISVSYGGGPDKVVAFKDIEAAITQSAVKNNTDGSISKLLYTANIEVAKPDGTLFDDEVTVLCEDKNGTEVFSVSTSSGVIAEQEIEFRRWTGTSETEITYSPHKITISAAGYETLVIDSIMVDGPINWHVELQAEVVYPSAADVRNGMDYGSGGNEYTGTCVVPGQTDVRAGVDVDDTIGVLDLPAETDVRAGVDYDNASKTGTLVRFFGEAHTHTITEESPVHDITEDALTHTITEEAIAHAISEQLIHTITEESLVHTIND